MQITLPVENLQQVYEKWEDAPIGTLISSGAMVAVRNDKQGYDRTFGPMVAIRAESSVGPALFRVSPDYRLIFAAKERRSYFSEPPVAMGPAVTIGGSHKLAILNLAPTNNPTPLASGDVLYDAASERVFVEVDYPDYAHQALVLRGQDQWKIVNRPTERVVKIGTLAVTSVTKGDAV